MTSSQWLWQVSCTSQSSTRTLSQKVDLLDLLTVAQRSNLPIYRFNCQGPRGLQSVNGTPGGNSQIQQADMSRKTDLALKCVSVDARMHSNPLVKSSAYELLIKEITVLSDPRIMDHPNIVDLGGICWDFAQKEDVWPALVFEKSEHGDMSTMEAFNDNELLPDDEILKLCLDVGHALVVLHQRGNFTRPESSSRSFG